METTIDQSEETEKVVPTSQIWNPAFHEFQFGDSPEKVGSNLPRPRLSDWLSLPQALEYRDDPVKYFELKLSEFGEESTKFLPPDVSVNEDSYLRFLFFNEKLFHISIRFFHDVMHQNYDKIVEAYARAVNTQVIESEHGKEFYYDDQRIIYFSCFHPERNYTCMDVILTGQTTSTDGHWFNLPTFHDKVPKSFIQLQPYKHDIVISYCQKDKEFVDDIYEHLIRSQFNVWIDLDNIDGPIVPQMAEAIEHSQFVLLCMSNGYKSSAHCQLEAEYAFKCQSILIPLVVEKDFIQTGWLGMLCGLRLKIDFTETVFDVAYETLLSEIARYRTETTKEIHWPTDDQQGDKQFANFCCRQSQDSASTLDEEKSTERRTSNDLQSFSLAWPSKNKEKHPQIDIISGYIFSVTAIECRRGYFSLKYDSVLNTYYRNGIEQEKRLGWNDFVYTCSNIQRKVEHDCQMVYLCRKKQGENYSTGSISWLMQLEKQWDKKYRFDRITLQYSSTTSDPYARVQWQLAIGDKKTIPLPEHSDTPYISFEYSLDEEEICIEHLRLSLIATLTSSNDHLDASAWQKAQLFRQSIEQTSHPEQLHQLQINVTIVDRKTFSF